MEQLIRQKNIEFQDVLNSLPNCVVEKINDKKWRY